MAKLNLGRITGADGAPGRDGEQGLPGVQGIQGPQGPKGDPGPHMPISDAVDSADSGVAASLAAVKKAYDTALAALEQAAAVAWENLGGKPDSFPPSVHSHDASQLSLGVIPVANGGTGSTSAAAARTALGIPGLPAAVAPRPQAAAGVGQFVRVYVTSGNLSLPSGGTWIYWGSTKEGSYTYWTITNSFGGIAAGGALLKTGFSAMFAWRIA